ncbi:MAG: DNA alkylation repair protein [Bacteroidaceae bacterium]|jgi:3-methyladenine DNA glycosylase AlkD
MEVSDTIRAIKGDLRLMMNGAASAAMRQRGLLYKLNFGVELPRIKEIAAKYTPDSELALALWKEPVRECRIMAALLQPVDEFPEDVAEVWVESIDNIELAQLTVMNLFSRLPYAPQKVFRWIADEREFVQVCGFYLAARLLARGMEISERAGHELRDQAEAALHSPSYFVRKAAAVALEKLDEQQSGQA